MLTRCTLALCLIGALLGASAQGSDPAPMVRGLQAGQKPGVGGIADLAWLTGRWIGQGLGGTIEEVFSEPKDGAIMGMFRLNTDTGPKFYEFTLFEQEGETITYRVKHFNPGMLGWETKDQSTAFRLVEMTEKVAYFNGLTYERTGDDTMTVHLRMTRKDGTFRIAKTDYVRSPL